jgi:hypothetical protein
MPAVGHRPRVPGDVDEALQRLEAGPAGLDPAVAPGTQDRDAILQRQATVEKVRCNPFALSLTIEGFSLPDRPGSVLLAWDRLYANARASSLFRWALTLEELRIENPHTALRRFEDGKVNLLEVVENMPNRKAEGRLPRALLQHVEFVERRRVLRTVDQRPHLRRVAEPLDLLAHHATDLQRVPVHAVVQKQDPGHEEVTVGSNGRPGF